MKITIFTFDLSETSINECDVIFELNVMLLSIFE